MSDPNKNVHKLGRKRSVPSGGQTAQPTNPLRSIRLSDGSFAKRIAGKNGWSIGGANRRGTIVHRSEPRARRGTPAQIHVDLHVRHLHSALQLQVRQLQQMKALGQQVHRIDRTITRVVERIVERSVDRLVDRVEVQAKGNQPIREGHTVHVSRRADGSSLAEPFRQRAVMDGRPVSPIPRNTVSGSRNGGGAGAIMTAGTPRIIVNRNERHEHHHTNARPLSMPQPMRYATHEKSYVTNVHHRNDTINRQERVNRNEANEQYYHFYRNDASQQIYRTIRHDSGSGLQSKHASMHVRNTVEKVSRTVRLMQQTLLLQQQAGAIRTAQRQSMPGDRARQNAEPMAYASSTRSAAGAATRPVDTATRVVIVTGNHAMMPAAALNSYIPYTQTSTRTRWRMSEAAYRHVERTSRLAMPRQQQRGSGMRQATAGRTVGETQAGARSMAPSTNRSLITKIEQHVHEAQVTTRVTQAVLHPAKRNADAARLTSLLAAAQAMPRRIEPQSVVHAIRRTVQASPERTNPARSLSELPKDAANRMQQPVADAAANVQAARESIRNLYVIQTTTARYSAAIAARMAQAASDQGRARSVDAFPASPQRPAALRLATAQAAIRANQAMRMTGGDMRRSNPVPQPTGRSTPIASRSTQPYGRTASSAMINATLRIRPTSSMTAAGDPPNRIARSAMTNATAATMRANRTDAAAAQRPSRTAPIAVTVATTTVRTNGLRSAVQPVSRTTPSENPPAALRTPQAIATASGRQPMREPNPAGEPLVSRRAGGKDLAAQLYVAAKPQTQAPTGMARPASPFPAPQGQSPAHAGRSRSQAVLIPRRPNVVPNSPRQQSAVIRTAQRTARMALQNATRQRQDSPAQRAARQQASQTAANAAEQAVTRAATDMHQRVTAQASRLAGPGDSQGRTSEPRLNSLRPPASILIRKPKPLVPLPYGAMQAAKANGRAMPGRGEDRANAAREASSQAPLVVAQRKRADEARAVAEVVSRESRQPQAIRLDVAAKRTVNHTVHETVIESLQQSIKTVAQELNQARAEWAKPGIDMNRLADQMFKEFSHRIRHAQQRRGL